MGMCRLGSEQKKVRIEQGIRTKRRTVHLAVDTRQCCVAHIADDLKAGRGHEVARKSVKGSLKTGVIQGVHGVRSWTPRPGCSSVLIVTEPA